MKLRAEGDTTRHRRGGDIVLPSQWGTPSLRSLVRVGFGRILERKRSPWQPQGWNVFQVLDHWKILSRNINFVVKAMSGVASVEHFLPSLSTLGNMGKHHPRTLRLSTRACACAPPCCVVRGCAAAKLGTASDKGVEAFRKWLYDCGNGGPYFPRASRRGGTGHM